jgi:hypothetical protein
MTVAEMTTEMLRKPDASLLVEWIDDHLDRPADADQQREDVRTVIAAYYEGVEAS